MAHRQTCGRHYESNFLKFVKSGYDRKRGEEGGGRGWYLVLIEALSIKLKPVQIKESERSWPSDFWITQSIKFLDSAFQNQRPSQSTCLYFKRL